MDPTTLLGIILGFALIVNGIGFAKIGNFIDIPSMVIVIGGVLYPFFVPIFRTRSPAAARIIVPAAMTAIIFFVFPGIFCHASFRFCTVPFILCISIYSKY